MQQIAPVLVSSDPFQPALQEGHTITSACEAIRRCFKSVQGLGQGPDVLVKSSFPCLHVVLESPTMLHQHGYSIGGPKTDAAQSPGTPHPLALGNPPTAFAAPWH